MRNAPRSGRATFAADGFANELPRKTILPHEPTNAVNPNESTKRLFSKRMSLNTGVSQASRRAADGSLRYVPKYMSWLSRFAPLALSKVQSRTTMFVAP